MTKPNLLTDRPHRLLQDSLSSAIPSSLLVDVRVVLTNTAGEFSGTISLPAGANTLGEISQAWEALSSAQAAAERA
jgi:hypothetical protein